MARSTETTRDIRRRQGQVFEQMAKDISEGVRSYMQVFALAAYSYVLRESYVGMGDGSPVWTGNYIASHHLSVGTAAYKERVRPDPPVRNSVDTSGYSVALSQAATALQMWQVGESIFLTNAAKDQTGKYYAGAIENGLSKKTPEGVYRLALSYAEKVTPRHTGAKPEGFSVSITGGI
jgi:hypothetical protein